MVTTIRAGRPGASSTAVDPSEGRSVPQRAACREALQTRVWDESRLSGPRHERPLQNPPSLTGVAGPSHPGNPATPCSLGLSPPPGPWTLRALQLHRSAKCWRSRPRRIPTSLPANGSSVTPGHPPKRPPSKLASNGSGRTCSAATSAPPGTRALSDSSACCSTPR